MKLYKHQQGLVDKFPKKYLLAWEMGSGKTLAAIRLADKTKEKTLVICPKSLKDNWYNEIDKFSLRKPNEYTIIHKEEFRKLASTLPKYNCIIADEIHHFSGLKSQMHKSLKAYLKHHNVEYFYGLTGTPYLSTPLNILALGILFGKDWTYPKFIYYFFNKIKMGNKYIPIVKPNIEKQIAALVDKLGNTIKLKDLIDVPKQIYKFEYFDLNNQQKKEIKIVEENEILPIVKWTKVHQIEQGTLKGDEYTDELAFMTPKTARIKELCAEHDKLAIVCRYNSQIAYLSKVLSKYNPYIINGSSKNKQDIIDKVNKLDKVVILLQSAMSEGYNLPYIPLMVFASMDFSLKNTLQIMARIQRINNIKKNVYLFLLTNGKSIDKAVYNSFKKKESFDVEIFKRYE